MKIILSRKGFDSSSGGVPSPIFPSGELWSLPIPTSNEHFHSYDEIYRDGRSVGSIVSDLTRGKIEASHYTHLDPDLRYEDAPRREGWRPVFGQAGSAESHLQSNNVGENDIFLFYGWFRRVELAGGTYGYIKDAPDLHVIYGWLQVEQRFAVRDRDVIPLWAREHQHCLRGATVKNDAIYVSKATIDLSGSHLEKPGAGIFRKFDSQLCLTCPGESRSVWRLPLWFNPSEKEPKLSYHKTRSRWQTEEGYVRLNSVGRGQEFVLDCEDYPEAIEWLANILSQAD